MAALDFDQVIKSFPGPVTALDRFTLSVADRELVVLVGPSGAGKTTALRIAAGLERTTSGSILMDGRPIDGLRPMQREMAMVFQQPALYPHLTVRDNAAFSLRIAKTPRGEIDRRVSQTAADLGIAELLDRYPDTLSGGQAQRAALARALVRRPNVLLLDEPLASLDAPLRAELRRDLRQARRRQPVTTLFVTHDQDEALALADRMVVLRGGKIEQIGTPEQVYEQPANRFVAAFIGSPPMNLVEGTLVERGEQLRFEFGDSWLTIAVSMRARLLPHVGQTVTVGLRPQHLMLTPPSTEKDSPTPLNLQIHDSEFCGDRWLVRGALKSGELLAALIENRGDAPAGKTVGLYVRSERACYFASGNEERNLLVG